MMSVRRIMEAARKQGLGREQMQAMLQQQKQELHTAVTGSLTTLLSSLVVTWISNLTSIPNPNPTNPEFTQEPTSLWRYLR